MTGLLAAIRVDLRMLRREFLGAVALVALGLLGAATAGDQVLGGGVRVLLAAGVMIALGIGAAIRLAEVDRGWAGLAPALPLRPAAVLYAQTLTRFGLAFLVGIAFTCAVSSSTDAPWHGALAVALWFLVLYQFIAWQRETGELGPVASIAVWIIALQLLVLTLPSIADPHGVLVPDRAGSLAATFGPRILGGLALILLVARLVQRGEALPNAGPKDIVKRAPPPEGALRRSVQPRSPAQVLRHIGLRGPKTWWILLVWFWLGMFLAAREGFGEAALWWAPMPVLVTGFLAVAGIRAMAEQFAFLRTYPMSMAPVWRRAILGSTLAFALGVAFIATAGPGMGSTPDMTAIEKAATYVRGPRHTSAELTHGRSPYGFFRPVLVIPSWAEDWDLPEEPGIGDPVVPRQGHPHGERDHAWTIQKQFEPRRLWRLRAEHDWRPGFERRLVTDPVGATRIERVPLETRPADQRWSARVPIEKEREHFIGVVGTYLRRVHGVRADDEEIGRLLHVNDTFQTRIGLVPTQLFAELWAARGDAMFQDEEGTHDPMFRRAMLTDAIADPIIDDEGWLQPPLDLYSYVPALERMKARFGPRVKHAARLTYLLDLGIQLLVLLVFIRSMMLRKSLWALLPLLAPISLYAWFGTRGQDWHLQARDWHLAWPWVSLGVFGVLASLLTWSIGRNLGRVGT